MTTKEELAAYFNEHVLYELLQLRYARKRLGTKTTKILWNAMFAAFNVSARNLYDFLNNKGGANEYNVKDFIPHELKLTSKSNLTGTVQLLGRQVFHFGKLRTDKPDRKINLKNVGLLEDWIETNISHCLDAMEEDLRSQIPPERAELPTAIVVTDHAVSSFP